MGECPGLAPTHASPAATQHHQPLPSISALRCWGSGCLGKEGAGMGTHTGQDRAEAQLCLTNFTCTNRQLQNQQFPDSGLPAPTCLPRHEGVTSTQMVPGKEDQGWGLTLCLFPTVFFPSLVSPAQGSCLALPSPSSPSCSCGEPPAAPKCPLLCAVSWVLWHT